MLLKEYKTVSVAIVFEEKDGVIAGEKIEAVISVNVHAEALLCVCEQRGTLSGVVIAVADFAVDTWNNPRFQGGLQAFGGLTEAVIGGGMALGSGGLAAPVGGLIMAHGLDHFFTGLQTAFSGNSRENVIMQLLQTTGMPPQIAGMVDGSLSIAGSMGGLAAIRASQSANFSLLPVGNNKVGTPMRSSKINNHSFEYHPRIRIRALQDPVAHNFPHSFDKLILKTKPITQANGTLLFRKAGMLNGKQVFFEIGLNSETKIIFHRTFRGGN